MSGSLTGRFLSKDTFITEMLKSLQMQSPPTYLREAMGVLSESIQNSIVGLDFSRLEDRTVAVLCSMGDDGKVKYEEIKLYEQIRGHTYTSCIIDDLEPTTSNGTDLYECIEHAHAVIQNFMGLGKSTHDYTFIDEASMMPLPLPLKPMKQNGRSASYLDMDPTKNTRKRKRR